MQENKEYIQEDEIELRELLLTIWQKRWFIVIFTSIITLLAIVYVFFKNPKPIYKGSLLVEIGYVQSENIGEQLLDNPNNLSKILSTKFDIQISIPHKTNSLIEISAQSTDKEKIKEKISKVYEFIKNRHLEKSKYYKSIIDTKQISNIKINDNQINKPKKKLIVAVSFVTGFILSIFIVFFIQLQKS